MTGPVLPPEIILSNEVIIHNSEEKAVNAFISLINECPKIWKDTGFAELPKENWMKIPLKTD